MKRVAFVAALVLGGTGAASALTLTGGPVYSLPGGGSCTVSGTPSITSPNGATVTCTGVNLAAHSNVYFGIRNDTNANGNTMTGAGPSGGSVFSFSSSAASSITYGSTTSFTSLSGAVSPTSQTVTNRLILSLASGSATVVSTAGTPANNSNGAIDRLFRLTSGSSFSFTVDLDASSPSFALGQANPSVYDPAHAAPGGGGDISKVDLAFYYSDCGDAVVDVGTEACDQGSGVNGTAGSCCASNCQFKSNGTGCTDDGNVCTTDTCNGSSVACQHPAGNTGFVCRATGGVCDVQETCTGASTSCPGDAKSTALCRGSAGVCDVADFCDGVSNSCPADAKSSALCRSSAGVCDVAESCNGVGDDCPADAKSTATCRAAAGTCDVAEVCDGVGDNCAADTLRPNGFVCNAGSGDLCDTDETCDGVLVTCPSDTLASSGTLCRAGSGDSCDPDETCTGVANQPCPADIVEPGTTVCNPGSGDVCDPDQFCPGVATGTCAADVVAPATTVCRSGSGDLCDPDELCTGVAEAACPSDIVAPNTTVCNPGSGDLCDPDELCTGTATNPCPADTVAPSSTVCRAAAGVCDAAENCSGTADVACGTDAKQSSSTPCRSAVDACDVAELCDGSSDTCPVDALQPDNTPCPDGLFCNGAETCQSGVCVDQNDPCVVAAICNESADVCQTDACPPTPQTCRTAVKSLLVIKNKTDNTKDKMIWKYIKGQPTTQADFADPTVGADYALCIYAGSTAALVAETAIPAGSNWATIGTKGYKYSDATLASDGVQKVILSGTGTSGKTKALLKARGAGVADPLDMGALQSPVTAQLINYQNGICWQGTYATAKKSTASLYKGKQ